ncbi:hypothetical protein [Formosa maritima]|uniref:Uncharacterized protein n=1 Tax=Formosa maritima TaxID=2592046 RepID=A0A5D0GGN5_9FLAO|nr:hypothetical protein [Formosa maritima]TYA58043.1 hypothetical protein FVF61_04315 [Formosa maritima]
MKTHLKYTSFNQEKSIEELQYNMLFQLDKLQFLKEELFFLQFLISSDIYSSKVMNLFENLEHFKKEINKQLKTCEKLIIDLSFHVNKITDKVECNDIACDNYFINTHTSLEQTTIKYFNQVSQLKLEIYNYLQSVINS